MFDFIKKLFEKKAKKHIELAPEDMAAELIRTAVEVSTNTVHDVFVQYSPHVQWLSVHIWIDGWFEGEKFHKEFIIKIGDRKEYEDCMVYLGELKNNGFF